MERQICRKCLLREEDPDGQYAYVMRLRNDLPPKRRCGDEVYEKRLRCCKNCPELAGATCMQCGCYVEIRAMIRSAVCPLHLW